MQNNIYDAVIIGAGPAGASCAVWLAHLGFNPIIIDRAPVIGGLSALNPFQDTWNVTAPDLTGEEVSQQMKKSLDSARVPVLLKQAVTGIVPVLDGQGYLQHYQVLFGEDKVLCGRKVVIASGVKHRRPLEMGEEEYPDILVGSGRALYQYDFIDKRVAVLGGGDNALENALYAKERGAQYVDIYARTLRAQHKWIKLVSSKNIHMGSYEFNPKEMRVNQKHYDAVLVFYGYQPQLAGLEDLHLCYKETGHIETDAQTCETNVSGIYAIGEVANRMHPCVVTSMADGIVAAKAIQNAFEDREF